MLGALTQGVNFNCNATICFGIGPVHEQFKTLQTNINFFAQLGRFAPLIVDGFIGDKTVTTANAAATAAGLPSPGATRPALAANALTFVAQLQSVLGAMTTQAAAAVAAIETPPEIVGTIRQIVVACRADKQDPTCIKAAQLCQQVKGTPTAQLPDIAEICGAVKRRGWIWWLVGGVAATTSIGLVLYHRKRP